MSVVATQAGADEKVIRVTFPDAVYNAARRAVPVSHCRFRTSNGGSEFCQDPAYFEGYCRFHFEALRRGEINELGIINERLSDQARRREINFHGLGTKGVYVEDDPRG